MRRRTKAALVLIALAVIAGAVGVRRALRYGFSARDQPTRLETVLAVAMRRLAVPARLRDLTNPLPASVETLATGRAHFADHCASCHGNDGRGKTTVGQALYPRAPDMTLAETQSRTDGELFATIENGIRLTGMPAWGDGTAESATESWALVLFIRHLPQIAPPELEEMRALNPRTPDEVKAEEEEREFLAGGAGH